MLDNTNVGQVPGRGEAKGLPGCTNRHRVRRAKEWQCVSMASRWTSAAFDATTKGFRHIKGHEPLWMFKAAPEERARIGPLTAQDMGILGRGR